MEKEVQEWMAQRQQQDKEWARDMEKHPRCGLLPSPEELAIGFDTGQDATDTRKDFDQVHQWLKKIEALNEKFYDFYQKPEKHSEFLDAEAYGSLIRLAFSNSFAAMLHTFSPELPEYVLWYYVGHGYDPNGDSSGKSSIPNLEKVGFRTSYNKIADRFAPKELQDQLVKGGELCLHHVGYCGLYGLLKPWIAAVKSKSMNNPSEKKNKHLIIILDSCYSGIMAQDLEELNQKGGPWNQNGCTVTIQAACSPDETTYGGYFTPGFLTLNQNQSLLKELKKEWELMEENTKDCYRSLPLPSPKVVTTRKDVEHRPLTLEFGFNNGHQITLFPDPGFFKFCSISIFEHEEEDLMKTRVLNASTTQTFMSSTNFTVLDYMLKTLQNTPFAGRPMGLFLINDPNDPNLAVCAHVHFDENDTFKVGKINLVHHKVPPQQNLLYVEDHDGLSKSQVKKGRHKVEYATVPKIPDPKKPADWEYWSWNSADPPNSVPMPSHITDPNALRCKVGNGARLVKKCHEFVESKEPGRWNDTSRWDQKSTDLSYSRKLRREERSEWMNRYIEKYKE